MKTFRNKLFLILWELCETNQGFKNKVLLLLCTLWLIIVTLGWVKDFAEPWQNGDPSLSFLKKELFK